MLLSEGLNLKNRNFEIARYFPHRSRIGFVRLAQLGDPGISKDLHAALHCPRPTRTPAPNWSTCRIFAW